MCATEKYMIIDEEILLSPVSNTDDDDENDNDVV